MPFIYDAQGCAPYFDDYSTRLSSHLAVRGTEITAQRKSPDLITMEVQHTDEQGSLALSRDGQSVKVTYGVKRYRREIERGLVGSLAGGALSGAVAGGAWEAYNGYDQSKHE